MTERALMDAVAASARLLGYRVFHVRPARRAEGWSTPVAFDGAGWPDLALCGRGRFLLRELKVGTNKLSDAQAAWLEDLNSCGVSYWNNDISVD
jgi:hypothetical protein